MIRDKSEPKVPKFGLVVDQEKYKTMMESNKVERDLHFYKTYVAFWKNNNLVPRGFMDDKEYRYTSKNVKNLQNDQRHYNVIQKGEPKEESYQEPEDEPNVIKGDEQYNNEFYQALLIKQRELAMRFNDLLEDRLEPILVKEVYVPKVKAKSFSNIPRSKSVESLKSKVVSQNKVKHVHENMIDKLNAATKNKKGIAKLNLESKMTTSKSVPQLNKSELFKGPVITAKHTQIISQTSEQLENPFKLVEQPTISLLDNWAFNKHKDNIKKSVNILLQHSEKVNQNKVFADIDIDFTKYISADEFSKYQITKQSEKTDTLAKAKQTKIIKNGLKIISEENDGSMNLDQLKVIGLYADVWRKQQFKRANKEQGDDKMLQFEEFLRMCRRIGLQDVTMLQDIFNSIDWNSKGQMSLQLFTYIQAGFALKNDLLVQE